MGNQYRDVVPGVKSVDTTYTNKNKLVGSNQGAADALYKKAGNTVQQGVAQAAQTQANSAIDVEDIKHQAFMKGLNNISKPLFDYFEVEAQGLAKKRGIETAQREIIEIDKIKQARELKKTKLDQIAFDYKIAPLGDKQLGLEAYDRETAFLEESIEQDDKQLEEYLSKGSFYNISENARADALNELYVQKVTLDINNMVNSLYIANLNNPDAFERNAKKIETTLSYVPKEFRGTIKLNLEQKIKSTKNKAVDNLKKKQADEITAVRNATIQQSVNLVTQDAFDGNNTTLGYNTVFENLDKQVKDGNMTAEQAGNTLTALKKRIDSNKELGSANRIYNDNNVPVQQRVKSLTEYAGNFLKTPQLNMDNSTKMSIYGEMINMATSLEASVKSAGLAQKKEDSMFLKDIMKRLTKGDMIVAPNDIQRAYSISAKEGRTEEFTSLNLGYQQMQKMNNMNVEGMQQLVNSTDKQLQFLEESGHSTFDDRTVYSYMQKQLQTNMKAIKEDSNAWLETHPMMTGGASYHTTNLGKFQPQVDQEGNKQYSPYIGGIIGELSTRFRNRFVSRAHLGTYEIMSKNEAHIMQQQYNAMPANDKFSFLGGLAKEVGFKEANNIFKGMFKDNPTSDIYAASIFGKGTNTDKNTATFMIQGSEKRRDKDFTGFDNSNTKEAEQTITSKLLGKSPNVAFQKEAIMDYYYGKSNDFEKVDNGLIKEAIQNVVGFEDSYSNQDVYSPKEDYLEPFMAKITTNDFFETQQYELPDTFQNWDQVRKELSTVSTDKWFSTDAMKWSLEYRGKGQYAVKNGNTYMTTKGKPFIINTYIKTDEMKPEVLYDIR